MCQRLQLRGFNGDGRTETTTVGTLGSVESEGVRCVKGYNVVVLTGTDAQTVHPHTHRATWWGGVCVTTGVVLFYRDGAL